MGGTSPERIKLFKDMLSLIKEISKEMKNKSMTELDTVIKTTMTTMEGKSVGKFNIV